MLKLRSCTFYTLNTNSISIGWLIVTHFYSIYKCDCADTYFSMAHALFCILRTSYFPLSNTYTQVYTHHLTHPMTDHFVFIYLSWWILSPKPQSIVVSKNKTEKSSCSMMKKCFWVESISNIYSDIVKCFTQSNILLYFHQISLNITKGIHLLIVVNLIFYFSIFNRNTINTMWMIKNCCAKRTQIVHVKRYHLLDYIKTKTSINNQTIVGCYESLCT